MAVNKESAKDRISVVFCTREPNDGTEGFIRHIAETSGCDTNIFCIKNPDGVSLSAIYADVIDTDEGIDDIVVFIHDDIEFLRKGWGSEVCRLFRDNSEYGIIGVAGSSEFDSGAAWWNYKKRFGQVLHRNDGKSWLTAFSPLLDKDLQEVAVVDGLFIAVNKGRISVNFDRNLKSFDFYDIDFCLSNLIGGKCKIGVTTNIRLAHMSVGVPRETWYENREIINGKYGKYYPIDTTKPFGKWKTEK